MDAPVHPYWLIPLLTLVGSCIVGSATLAQDTSYRPNRVVAFAMGLTGFWSILETLYSVQSDAASALVLTRLLGFAYLPLAPAVLELLHRLGVLVSPGYEKLRRPLWAGVLALAVLHAVTPWFIADVHPAPAGWRYEFGAAFWLGLSTVLAACAGSGLQLLGSGVEPAGSGRPLRWLGGMIWLPIAVACITDVLLPTLGVDGPRLGAASIVGSVGLLWLGFFAMGSPTPASSALARRFLDRVPDGVAILRVDGIVRTANESLGRILARPAESLLGRSVEEALGVDARASGEREVELRTAAGPVPAAVWSSAIVDRQGTAIGSVLVVRDQRALAELRRQLVSSGQMSALGELAAGIAHEVNNPTAYVVANLNQLGRHAAALRRALRKELGEAGEEGLLAAGPRIDVCLEEVARVVEIVREVRSFAHRGEGHPVLCGLNEIVAGALRLASPRLRARHTVVSELAEPLPELRCAPQDLKHAILSLLLTLGREAAPGRLRVATGCGRQDDAAVLSVELVTEHAVPAEVLRDRDERLLGEPGDSRSLGLMIPGHIVRQQGGSLETSAAGGGTRVSIRLPVPDSPRTEALSRSSAAQVPA